MSHAVPTTRLAPSPTGALHLGNARTFLVNWAMARQRGQRIVLRIEDLDGPRVKAKASREAIDVLRWLGLDWDGEPVYQSTDLSPYRAALDALSRKRLIYACRCTRSEIARAQSAPHGDEHELRYPGVCRPELRGHEGTDARRHEGNGGFLHALGDAQDGVAWRVRIPDGPITFCDALHGEQAVDVQREVGDFVVATKAGLPAYQLAVVVDDARQGVTEVVRGDDLLASTARQVWLYRLLELGAPPRYVHLPLVLGPDGRRLAKRHGDTRLASYRAAGVTPERVIGLLAWWSGAAAAREEMSAREFAAALAIERLPRESVTFTEEDHAWLLMTNRAVGGR